MPPLEDSDSASSKRRGRKRRPKSRPTASQGDAVLIDFMGNLNEPEVANRAGEETLNYATHSDSSDTGEHMDEDRGSGRPGKKNFSLVQAAQHALPLLSEEDASMKDSSKELGEGSRPSRPTIITPAIQRQSAERDSVQSTPRSPPRGGQFGLSASQNGEHGKSTGLPSSPGRQNTYRERDNSQTMATSPDLRKAMIPKSEGSSSENLPPMKSSPQPFSSKSATSPQSLPSLHSLVGPLVEGHTPSEGRVQTFPLPGSLHSPITSSVPRTNTYPGTQQLMNGLSPRSYPSNQPSPASTYSEASPREPARYEPTFTSMSPPEKPTPHQYHPSGPSPPSDQLTPLSTNSHPSASSYSTQPSPNSEPISMEGGRRILPPPIGSDGQILTQSFKCDYPGCAAASFSTQYLLNSHANVHSSNRPHYCPVKTCSRSEGGKGFKRKNEMIRHGLVHQSPGYICPFCPEREHKYPRPDNLQR